MNLKLEDKSDEKKFDLKKNDVIIWKMKDYLVLD